MKTKEKILLESIDKLKINPIIDSNEYFIGCDLDIIYNAMEEYYNYKMNSISEEKEMILKKSNTFNQNEFNEFISKGCQCLNPRFSGFTGNCLVCGLSKKY